jgi:catechol 2,3-dioxygenase
MDNGIDPRTRIGHVHLRVSDLQRAEDFYCDVLGFKVRQRFGADALFLSSSDYHHHIGLNTWESKGAPPAPRHSAGLYHFAILYPDRRALADALRRVLDHGVMVDGASDHGVSEAIYLHDPDGNGIELYWDRDPSEWPVSADGSVAMGAEPLDIDDLLAEAE